MTTTRELAEQLLAMAGKAAEGKADVAQVDALCKCTKALVNLTRLQMDAEFQVANGQMSHIPGWVNPQYAMTPQLSGQTGSEPESAAILRLRGDLARTDEKLAGDMEQGVRVTLQRRRDFILGRIEALKKGE